MWTENYKAFLNHLVESDVIASYEEQHTHDSVLFKVFGQDDKLKKLAERPFKLRMEKPIATGNMHLFDSTGRIKKYNSPLEIIEEFVPVRMQMYEQRRKLLIDRLGKVVLKLENQARFTRMFCKGELRIARRPRDEILADIKSLGFAPARDFEEDPTNVASQMPVVEGDQQIKENSTGESNEDAIEKSSALAKEYDYLLKLPLWHLTAERVHALEKQLEENHYSLAALNATTPTQLWLRDLAQIKRELAHYFS
jgi:DNA topoisomerase-2